ncbi:MAG TPA: DoxX family protein [Candidatus Eisenbacteria bacterium]|jgi:putative oxidoreductase
MQEGRSGAAVSMGLLLLRAGAAGLLLFGHGWGKLAHFAERAPRFPDPLGVGSTTSLALVIFAEVFCAAAVTLGFRTRLAVVPLLVFFAVALFVHHAHDPWSVKELAAVYAVPMLALLLTGPGRFSLDEVLARRRARPRS